MARLISRKMSWIQMCVPKKPRMKRTIAATSFANHPPPPVSAAWTPKYAIANPTPIINVRWQRGPHRATMLNFFDSGSMSCNPAAPSGMRSVQNASQVIHSQSPLMVEAPSLPFWTRFKKQIQRTPDAHPATLDTAPLAKSDPRGSYTRLSSNHFQSASGLHCDPDNLLESISGMVRLRTTWPQSCKP